MQVCTSLHTDNHASTSPLFLLAGCPSCRPTNSVKAPKASALKAYDNLPNTNRPSLDAACKVVTLKRVANERVV